MQSTFQKVLMNTISKKSKIVKVKSFLQKINLGSQNTAQDTCPFGIFHIMNKHSQHPELMDTFKLETIAIF